MTRSGSILILFLSLLMFSCTEQKDITESSGDIVFMNPGGCWGASFQDYKFTQTFESDSFYLLTYKREVESVKDTTKTVWVQSNSFKLVTDTNINPQVWISGNSTKQLWFTDYREFIVDKTPLKVYKYIVDVNTRGYTIRNTVVFWCPNFGIIIWGTGQASFQAGPLILSSPENSKDSVLVSRVVERVFADKDFMYFKGSAAIYQAERSGKDTVIYGSWNSPPVDNPHKSQDYEEYISANTSYPDSALASCSYGTLWYKVILEKPDSIKRLYTTSGRLFGDYFPMFDRECRRVIKAIPNFGSCRYKGRPIRTHYRFKFDFEPPNDEKCRDSLDARMAREKSVQKREIYTIVEQMPTYGDGTAQALLDYVEDNLVYPEEAHKHDVKASVYLSFMINKMGDIENSRVLRCKGAKFCKQFEAAALKLIRDMPRWNPGKQRGELVNVQYTLPVQFSP